MTTATARYPGKAERLRAKLPFVFLRLGEWWHLPLALTHALFKALQTARWSTAHSLYYDLYVFDRTALGNPGLLLSQTLHPHRLMTVLEALVAEGRLTRAQGNTVEECVLQCMTAHGTWR